MPINSPIWTATLISVIGNVDRFHNYGQFRAYVGWFPQIQQSGTSINSSSLAKDGTRLGRNVFGQMARTLITPKVRETPFRIYYERLLGRGMKQSKAMSHLSGKLASVLFEWLKTYTLYDEVRHRKQLGIPTADIPDIKTNMEIQDALIDNPELSDIVAADETI